MNTRLSAVALSVALAFGAGDASAELARVGPINRANGYPQWYQDKTGLTLDFCQSQTQTELSGGWCVLVPADTPSGTAPEAFPNNFGDEHFFWLANAGTRRAPIPGSAQTTVASLVLALEGAFAGGAVAPGDQMVFARLRFRLDPVPFNGDYTFYTPFGKFVVPGQAAGARIFFSEDIGVTAGNFAEALKGRVGPFLLPSATPGGPELPPIPQLAAGQDPFYDSLVAGGGATPYPGNGRKYLADPARVGPLTGSPMPDYLLPDGTTRNPNIFRIEGPNGFVFESTDFTVSGRLYEGAISGNVSVDRASYARSASGNQVDIYATAAAATQPRTPGAPPPATVSTQLAYFDAPCTPTIDTNGNPVPPYSAPANSTANQMFSAGSQYFGQSRPASVPSELCVQANAVTAGGQATTTFLSAQLGDQVFISEALYDPSSQALSVKAKSSDQVTVQALSVEGLGNIDPATGQLVITELLAPPSKVTVLSSGRGLSELQVSTGAVAGGGSPLPVANNDTVGVFEDCAGTTPPSGSTACATPLTIDVLTNDTGVAGGVVAVTSPPTLGTAAVNPDGTIRYTPRLNASGSDRLAYKVTVGGKTSNEASVAVTIIPVNDPPVAAADSVVALRGAQSSLNVLANDSDPDGASDLASAVIVTGNADLGLAAGTNFAGGVVSFTPSATMAAGTATFTYKAVDRSGVQSANPATVTVNVSGGETMVPGKARYTQDKGRWVVSGTDNVSAGQTITFKYQNGTYRVNGACTGNAAGVTVGTAVVSAGTWSYDQLLTSTIGVQNPSNTGNSANFWCARPTSLQFTSSQSPATATFAIEFR